LGRTVRRLLNFILIPEFLVKVFEKIRFRADCPQTPGGRSVILYRTGCCRGTGRTVHVLPADSPRGPGGRSAWPWRTVHPAQRSALQPLTSRFYRWNSNADSPRGRRRQSARHAFCP
jgi:hypothetical protein